MKIIIGLFLLCMPVTMLWGQQLKPASFYLNHAKVSKKAKALYRDQHLTNLGTEKYFSVLDSLQTANAITRPFYFSLVPKMMKHADGYVAEVIGTQLFEVLVKHPAYIFQYFTDNPAKASFIKSMAKLTAFGMQMWCNQPPGPGSEDPIPGSDKELCYELLEKQVHQKCTDANMLQTDVYKKFMAGVKSSPLW